MSCQWSFSLHPEIFRRYRKRAESWNESLSNGVAAKLFYFDCVYGVGDLMTPSFPVKFWNGFQKWLLQIFFDFNIIQNKKGRTKRRPPSSEFPKIFQPQASWIRNILWELQLFTDLQSKSMIAILAGSPS